MGKEFGHVMLLRGMPPSFSLQICFTMSYLRENYGLDVICNVHSYSSFINIRTTKRKDGKMNQTIRYK